LPKHLSVHVQTKIFLCSVFEGNLAGVASSFLTYGGMLEWGWTELKKGRGSNLNY